jgi:hypothetical protein
MRPTRQERILALELNRLGYFNDYDRTGREIPEAFRRSTGGGIFDDFRRGVRGHAVTCRMA